MQSPIDSEIYAILTLAENVFNDHNAKKIDQFGCTSFKKGIMSQILWDYRAIDSEIHSLSRRFISVPLSEKFELFIHCVYFSVRYWTANCSCTRAEYFDALDSGVNVDLYWPNYGLVSFDEVFSTANEWFAIDCSQLIPVSHHTDLHEKCIESHKDQARNDRDTQRLGHRRDYEKIVRKHTSSDKFSRKAGRKSSKSFIDVY